ncbi:hypothetical protein FHW23_000080 [Curtobacterium pusillum]|uniref:Uncharacterized protein n=1 Tax=Curtobacterium pusillum TaxID=69373 RepID=A0AAW3T3M9_9MICO|nr:hypothetical protein [Curtobacterium pusillum]MBA8988848.1 hypothetical protein [Curtobacterium pusillum]
MMRRSLAAVAAAALLLAGTVTFAAPAVAATAVTPSVTGCETSQLKLAPHIAGDKDPDGHDISISPGPKGMFVPVIMVHGWNGEPANFTGKIDLTANKVGKVDSRTSLVGQLQDMAGSAVYTFDYHQWSDRWVTDSHIGPALATAIDCLYKASGQKVILVAHSMGGLAIEQTFSSSIPRSNTRASEISTVVTLGTPYKGSALDSIAHGVTLSNGITGPLGGQGFLTLTTAILAACGQASTVNADNICTKVGLLKPVTTLHSDAANALQYGSKQINALPSMPDSIHLLQLAGHANYETQSSWFRQLREASTAHLGDTIVTEASAVPSPSKDNAQATCTYTVNVKQAARDEAGVILGVVAKNDARGLSVPVIDGSVPCGHGQLTRDIELTNDTLGAVYDDINARMERALFNAAATITVPAGVCTENPLTLASGAVTIPDSGGYGGIYVPGIGTEEVDDGRPAEALADGRAQMSDPYRGALAIEFLCSTSGIGGAQSYIGIYKNDLTPVGVVSGYTLTTASGAGQPTTRGFSFTDGKLRAKFGWMAFDSSQGLGFDSCPYTEVQLDYTISPGQDMQHGPLTTLEGDATCG